MADATTPNDLRIGGLTRLTTIDYPGELSAVVFCQGCPWRCRYCQNLDLLDPNGNPGLLWTEVRTFLEQRQGLLDAVVFSGGEPTAQAALPAAMAEVRAMGFKVGLHTSGAYPDRLRQWISLIDWVGLDIKALPDDYPAITGVPGSGQAAWESLHLLLDAGVALEVRTTVLPGWTPQQVAQLSGTIANAGVRHYCLQACQTRRMFDPTLATQGLPLSRLVTAVDSGRFSRFLLRDI